MPILGGAKGNYIMFASATSGDRDNNNKFSHCSIQNISAVLDAVVDNAKTNCLEVKINFIEGGIYIFYRRSRIFLKAEGTEGGMKKG